MVNGVALIRPDEHDNEPDNEPVNIQRRKRRRLNKVYCNHYKDIAEQNNFQVS